MGRLERAGCALFMLAAVDGVAQGGQTGKSADRGIHHAGVEVAAAAGLEHGQCLVVRERLAIAAVHGQGVNEVDDRDDTRGLWNGFAPQALRIAIAPTVGFAVQVIKGTALASIIGFVELTKAGTMLTNVTYQPFKVFALVALGYFILCYPLSRYSRYLENKFNASHHH